MDLSHPGGPTRYAHAVSLKSTKLLNPHNAIEIQNRVAPSGISSCRADDANHAAAESTANATLFMSQTVCGAQANLRSLIIRASSQTTLSTRRAQKTARKSRTEPRA